MGDAGGVGEPGDTVRGLIVDDGGDSVVEGTAVVLAARVVLMPTTPPPLPPPPVFELELLDVTTLLLPPDMPTLLTMLLPRRWHSPHCIRKRVTASRGRKA